jgi:hypothetical protein
MTTEDISDSKNKTIFAKQPSLGFDQTQHIILPVGNMNGQRRLKAPRHLANIHYKYVPRACGTAFVFPGKNGSPYEPVNYVKTDIAIHYNMNLAVFESIAHSPTAIPVVHNDEYQPLANYQELQTAFHFAFDAASRNKELGTGEKFCFAHSMANRFVTDKSHNSKRFINSFSQFFMIEPFFLNDPKALYLIERLGPKFRDKKTTKIIELLGKTYQITHCAGEYLLNEVLKGYNGPSIVDSEYTPDFFKAVCDTFKFYQILAGRLVHFIYAGNSEAIPGHIRELTGQHFAYSNKTHHVVPDADHNFSKNLPGYRELMTGLVGRALGRV